MDVLVTCTSQTEMSVLQTLRDTLCKAAFKEPRDWSQFSASCSFPPANSNSHSRLRNKQLQTLPRNHRFPYLSTSNEPVHLHHHKNQHPAGLGQGLGFLGIGSHQGSVLPFIEWFGLEGTLKIIWFQPPAMGRDTFHQPRLLRAPSNLALSTAREGAATASLGNLGQGLTALTGKNFFPISNLNLASKQARFKPTCSK